MLGSAQQSDTDASVEIHALGTKHHAGRHYGLDFLIAMGATPYEAVRFTTNYITHLVLVILECCTKFTCTKFVRHSFAGRDFVSFSRYD